MDNLTKTYEAMERRNVNGRTDIRRESKLTEVTARQEGKLDGQTI